MTPSSPLARALVAAALVSASLSLSACSGSPADGDVRTAATDFLAAEGDGQRACQLLAPGTQEELQKQGSCAEQVTQAKLSGGAVREVYVAGHSARVVAEDDVLFLAQFDNGWKVTAAGCTSQGSDPAAPYDCDIKGS